MFAVNFASNIIAMMFLMLLFFVSKTTRVGESDTNLFTRIVFIRIVCSLVEMANDLMLCFVGFNLASVVRENQWFMSIKNVLSDICVAMFYAYMVMLSACKKKRLEMLVKFFYAVIGILVVLNLISMVSDNVYRIEDGRIVHLWGFIVNEYLGFVLTFSMALVLLVILCRRLEKIFLLSFAIYIVIGGASVVLGFYTDLSIFSISEAFSLLVIYIFVHQRNINMNRVTTVENALKVAEEANAILEKSYTSLEYKNSILYSMSKIYKTAYLIDLEKGWYEEIGLGDRRIQNVVGRLGEGIQEALNQSAESLAAEDFVRQNLDFVDLTTLSQRMMGKKVIFSEGLNNRDKWIRYSFIRVGEDVNQELKEVVYTSLDIEVQKRESEKQIWASRIDSLTKVYNRTAFVVEQDELEAKGIGDDLWYISVDINGLKNVNDTLGLPSGDQLIVGTAYCLGKVFGHYGNIYRTSGNRFAVILRGEKIDIDKSLSLLDKEMKGWKGTSVDSLSFAKGCVCSSQVKSSSMSDIAKEADRLMMEDKKKYYAKK